MGNVGARSIKNTYEDIFTVDFPQKTYFDLAIFVYFSLPVIYSVVSFHRCIFEIC